MLLGKSVFIIAFSVVSFNSGIYGEEQSLVYRCLDWSWHCVKEHATCVFPCWLAVHMVAVVATPVGVAAGSLASKMMYKVGGVKARSWIASLQSIDVIGVTVNRRTVVDAAGIPWCLSMCRSSAFSEERQGSDLNCYTHRINGMKGLDVNSIKAKKVNNIKECEGLCNDRTDCKAFRYLSKNSFCFVYDSTQHIADDVSESQFFVKRCVLCYMNTTKNFKGRDNEIASVWEDVSSLEKCEDNCMKSDDCSAVHFDGEMCFKFTNEGNPYKKTGIDFSRKICEQFTEEPWSLG